MMAWLNLALVMASFMCPSSAVFPVYPGTHAPTEELVAYYFNLGHRIADICGFLALCHGTVVSFSTMKRLLRRLHLRRNNAEANLRDILRAIVHLHQNGFKNAGYKMIWKLLNTYLGVRVTQRTVLLALRVIDPEGVNLRLHRRLRRRAYCNKGPNFCVHVDGYDKLKPYGIAIHGAIDGFSRKILWLKAGPSNNNPYYVTRYYFDHIREMLRFPRCIRVDRGTENVFIVDLQMALWNCTPDAANAPPILVGRSSSNQRIERFWGSLRGSLIDFWITYFKDMLDSGMLDNSDNFYIESIRFCFLDLVQSQLDTFKQTWNLHRIRQQRIGETPAGIPTVLYDLPEIYNTRDYSYRFPCDVAVLNELRSQYSVECPLHGCTENHIQLIELLTDENRLHFGRPNTLREARMLYCSLIEYYNTCF